MTYRERLAHWAVVRLLPNFQRVIVARFRSRSDADGYAMRLRQLMPTAEFVVLFDLLTGGRNQLEDHSTTPPLISLQHYIADYRPQLKRVIAAIDLLQSADLGSEAFSQALSDLHAAVTVLEPYSESIVVAINRLTEGLPD